MRTVFFLKEASHGLARSSAPVLVAVGAVVLAALALGLLVPLAQATAETSDELHATRTVKLLAAGGNALLLLGSAALVANAIRTSILARRREVEVMRLVGATRWFIRCPFVIEGAVVGLVGGLVAVLLLAFAKATLVDPLSDRIPLVAAPDTVDFPALVVLLLVGSLAVAAAGSGVTMRRFLPV